MIPKGKYKDFRTLTSFTNQNEIIDSALKAHPFTHSIEVYTNSQNLQDFPPYPNEFFQVLLNMDIFRDESVLDGIFHPSTKFVSLSSIQNGNGMFINQSSIVFILNEPTYQRFGLSGKKFGKKFMVIITNSESKLLRKIRVCEPVEGLMYSCHIEMFSKYFIRSKQRFQQVSGWTPSGQFTFSDETDFFRATDELLKSKKFLIESDVQKLSFTGFIELDKIKSFLISLAERGWVLLFIWDFKHILSTFTGKGMKTQGFGGGCDCLYFGNQLDKGIRLQTVCFLE